MKRLHIYFFLAITLLIQANACKQDVKKEAKTSAPKMDPTLLKYSTFLEADPNNDSLLYLRAATYWQLDAYDEALIDIGKAIKLDSMQPMYYHLMADVFLDYSRANDSRRAIDVLQVAAQKFPDRISTLLKLSEFQLIVKKHGDALKTINEIMKRDPQNAEAFFMAGRVALDQNDTTNAIVMFQKSVKINSGNDRAWMFLGQIAANRNNRTAIQYFDNVLRVDSLNLEARENQGAFYKRRGEFDKAFAIYKDIVIRNPDYSNAYFDMGMIYLELDSLSKARDHFDIAIKTDPLFIKAFYYRGVCAETEGNNAAALYDYKQAAGMAPNYKEAVAARDRLAKIVK